MILLIIVRIMVTVTTVMSRKYFHVAARAYER